MRSDHNMPPGASNRDLDPAPRCEECGKPLTVEEQELCADMIGQLCGWCRTPEDDFREDR